jgi:nucleotide-binding universal stress UspA family protein
MKILIAYDGSDGADTSLDGLQRAGLPADAEALVVSVAEVWLPPPDDEVDEDIFPLKSPPGLKQARERAARMIEQTQELAERGSKTVQRLFSRWRVNHEALSGSPPFEVLSRAGDWQPDLIVVGSHGHTALGRFVLGSVSQKILAEAQTSVRIGRRATGSGSAAQRIVLGVDGSPGSQAAVKAVAAREWASGSEVRVVVVQDLMKAFPGSLLVPRVNEFVDEVNEAEYAQAEKIAAKAANEVRAGLADKNITVSFAVEAGNPKQVIVRDAEEFGADCIFTGAAGFSNRIERFILGSVSAAVAARAHCSVEVIREEQSVDRSDSSPK